MNQLTGKRRFWMRVDGETIGGNEEADPGTPPSGGSGATCQPTDELIWQRLQ
jgi:hypothetical protein